MSQKYIRELIRAAQTELPQLQYDFQNASTHMTLQAATQRLFNLVALAIYEIIQNAVDKGESVLAAPPAPPPAPVHIPPPLPQPQADGFLPPPPMIVQPVASPSAALPGSDGAVVQPGAINVVITPSGTKAISPDGRTTYVPPGEAVDLAATTGRPVPPPAPPGVASVVLPPGGGMTPEVLAALSNRQGTPPEAPTEPKPSGE